MSTQQQHDRSRIRFDPAAPGWMVATVNGITLACTPVRSGEVDTAAGELAKVLSGPVEIEIRNLQGQVERTLRMPGASGCGVAHLPLAADEDEHSQAGRVRSGAGAGGWFAVAVMAVITAILLLGHAVLEAGWW